MKILDSLFGTGSDLTIIQMSLRGIVIFILALAIIRISGKRAFGMKMPLDNVVTILLGAILSRAVVGASPFVPVIITCTLIALIHRLFSFLSFTNHKLGNLVKGEETILYADGKMIEGKMKECSISKKDLMEGIRLTANTEKMEDIERIYLERNGHISVVKKKQTLYKHT